MKRHCSADTLLRVSSDMCTHMYTFLCVCMYICYTVGIFKKNFWTPLPLVAPLPPPHWNVADDGDVIFHSLNFSRRGGSLDQTVQSASLQGQKNVHSPGASYPANNKGIVTADPMRFPRAKISGS